MTGATRVVAIFPPLPQPSPVDALRRRHDPVAGVIAPHITLVFPFRSALTTDRLRSHVERAVAPVRAFPIRLAGITGSEGEYLFLNVKRGNDGIIDLHDRLYTGPLGEHLSREHTFTPHMTVGRFDSPDALRAALAETASTDLRIDTAATAVTVLALDDTVELHIPLA